MAHQLARLVYRLLQFGALYVDKGIEHYEAQFGAKRLKWLHKQATAFNVQALPLQEGSRPASRSRGRLEGAS